MNNENNKKGRGIFYGVIGVATLVVAIIGATFAYFTASQSSNNGDITGNATSVSFGLSVTRDETTDQTNGGLIPMSNSMVQSAVYVGGIPSVGGGQSKVACVDDLGNSVCQIYKVTVTNTSSAALFLDGYVSLTGGLAAANASTDVSGAPTTMRYARVYKDTTNYGPTGYTTGTVAEHATISEGTVIGASNSIPIAAIGTGTVNNGHNLSNIYVDGSTSGIADADIYCAGGLGEDTCATINGSNVGALKGNYIRTSANVSSAVANGTSHTYTRTEFADALVFDLLVPVNASRDVYFVVWLHENGLSQNPATQGGETNFFGGIVTFMSGQGGEVSATFSGIAKTG